MPDIPESSNADDEYARMIISWVLGRPRSLPQLQPQPLSRPQPRHLPLSLPRLGLDLALALTLTLALVLKRTTTQCLFFRYGHHILITLTAVAQDITLTPGMHDELVRGEDQECENRLEVDLIDACEGTMHIVRSVA